MGGRRAGLADRSQEPGPPEEEPRRPFVLQPLMVAIPLVSLSGCRGAGTAKMEAEGERLHTGALGTHGKLFRPVAVSFDQSISSFYLGNNKLHSLTMKITFIIEFLVGKIISLE